MITEAIKTAMAGQDLAYDTARLAMEEIMDGSATPAQIAAFLTAMRIKGETISEITACASVMRQKSVAMPVSTKVMDIVGTGGDGTGTFNISTTSAFVVAAAGVPVAKHGNRGVSSKSGAADVLEHLGANIRISPSQSRRILMDAGICFLFAQDYHGSMRHAAPVRKELGVRTIFNVLGPLSNPAAASMQLMGVYDASLTEPLARVLSNLGVQRGLVIHGMDGMDEATLTTETKATELRDGEIRSYVISPEEAGLSRCSLADLSGGDGRENARITRAILSGRETGPRRDIVLMNAGLALGIAGLGESLRESVLLAESLVDSGKALAKLDEFVALTNMAFDEEAAS